MDDQRVGTGKLVHDEVVAARSGGAWLVEMGQRIRITDIEGSAIGDFVCFNANNLDERLSQARTKANQGRLMITTGHHLYTRDNNIIFTIDTDTYGVHDLQYGMCSAWVFENFDHKYYDGFSTEKMTVGGPLGVPPFGCYEVLQKALEGRNISPGNIPDPFNLFQTLEYDYETSEFKLITGHSRPGDYIDLIARMDALAALSACPSMGRPLRVQIFSM
jgi:uncharacterized protein